MVLENPRYERGPGPAFWGEPASTASYELCIYDSVPQILGLLDLGYFIQDPPVTLRAVRLPVYGRGLSPLNCRSVSYRPRRYRS